MTKKEAKARKLAWQQALAEGRIVRSNSGMTLRSYATKEQAEQAFKACIAVGVDAEIIQVNLNAVWSR